MWAHNMTVQDYEDLLNRGWRRSGKYTYKPTMEQTCCPQYTIRCEVLNYKLRKSHKKVLKSVNKYLIHGIKSGGGDDKEETDTKADVETKQEGSDPEPTAGVSTVSGDKLAASHKQSCPPPIPGAGADASKPKCKKAKQLRMERKLAKSAARDVTPVTPTDKGQQKTSGSKSNEKTLEDYLSEPDKAEKCAHKLEMRLVRTYPKSKEFEESIKESHDVYHRYQTVIHKDPPHKPNMKQYTRFLVDSSLQPKEVEGGLPLGYGSFHQQYILDGKIICVGVIDILPTLVSSKYLYYDPDYYFLSLGTYSALREIQFVRELNKYSSDMIYYYMGFYLQNCPKMKYKGQYYPSFLLCPETNTWHPIEKCSPLLDNNKYSRFADKETEDEEAKVDINDTLVLHARQAMRYEIYNAIKSALKPGRSDADEVKEYAELVGKTCASRMLLFRK